jgi:hypothetical protein
MAHLRNITEQNKGIYSLAGYRCDKATDNKSRCTVPLTDELRQYAEYAKSDGRTYRELADLRTGKAIFFSMSLVEKSVDIKSVPEEVEDDKNS